MVGSALRDLIASVPSPDILRVPIGPDDLAVLQYTGGTTGTPKGAMLTHANVYVNVQQVSAWAPTIGYGEDKVLGVLPFFHVFAMTVVMNYGIANRGAYLQWDATGKSGLTAAETGGYLSDSTFVLADRGPSTVKK